MSFVRGNASETRHPLDLKSESTSSSLQANANSNSCPDRAGTSRNFMNWRSLLHVYVSPFQVMSFDCCQVDTVVKGESLTLPFEYDEPALCHQSRTIGCRVG